MAVQLVDRETYLRLVGINTSTLSRWISEAGVEPRTRIRNGRRAQYFTGADVRYGQRLKAFLDANRGRYKLAHAVGIVEGYVEAPVLPVDPAKPLSEELLRTLYAGHPRLDPDRLQPQLDELRSKIRRDLRSRDPSAGIAT